MIDDQGIFEVTRDNMLHEASKVARHWQTEHGGPLPMVKQHGDYCTVALPQGSVVVAPPDVCAKMRGQTDLKTALIDDKFLQAWNRRG